METAQATTGETKMTAATIKIESGKYRGTYNINDAGKISQTYYTSTGESIITVGRGTSRHKAVTEAFAE